MLANRMLNADRASTSSASECSGAYELRIAALVASGRGQRESLWALGRLLETDPSRRRHFHSAADGAASRAELFALAFSILRLALRAT